MLNYHETDLVLVTPDIKQSILEFIDTEFNKYVTTDHKLFNDQTKFIFAKLPKNLNDKILELLPEKFKGPELDPFVRIQYTANGNVDPHIDRGRTSGLITVLTDDRSTTSFYNWKSTATRKLSNNFISVDNLDELIPAESAVLTANKTYLFNHAAIHDVIAKDQPRITLNILYCTLPYSDLVRIYVD